MADRYWVGGAGTWDATTTTNWSATSGGAGVLVRLHLLTMSSLIRCLTQHFIQ